MQQTLTEFLDPTPVREPLACYMPIDSLRPPVSILSKDSISEVAAAIAATGRQWVWVEGFSAAGKSNFALRLAHRTGWQYVELDALTHGREIESTRYVDHIDREQLAARLGSAEQRTQVIVDGVCLRDVLEQFAPHAKPYVVYVAKVSRNTSHTYTWHDGIWLEQPSDSLPWLHLETNRYHAAYHPYTDADRVFLRVE